MLQNLTDLISNSSTIRRLDASTSRSAQRDYHPPTISHTLKIICLAVHSVQVFDMLTHSDQCKKLFEAVIQLIYESVGITSASWTTRRASESTIQLEVVRFAQAVRRLSHPQESDTLIMLAKCCLEDLGRKAEWLGYVPHLALG